MKNKRLSIRLLIGLASTALCVWCGVTIVAWNIVKKEVKEVFDAQQVLFAQRLATSDLHDLLDHHGKSIPSRVKASKRHYDDDALAFAIFSAQGEKLFTDGHNGDKFIFEHKFGFSQGHILDDDEKWRIYWLPVQHGKFIIAVGQELEYREKLVNKMVFKQTSIWCAGLPILLVVAFVVFYQALTPIRRLSQNVQTRQAGDVSLLSTTNIPAEILPLVNNLNQFFARIGEQLERERRFVSDAAHELCTPLTALRIQAEVAQLADNDPKTRDEALNNLTKGIDRTTQLIKQLLTLSRIENFKELEDVVPIHWSELVISAISDLYGEAQKRQMNLVFDNQGEPKIRQGQPLLLTQMLHNLIYNAIKYCPVGAEIKVMLTPARLIIEDNGEGVPPEELNKLGQRFYRIAGQNEKGSGLGLSIVTRIAELHHYRFRLENVVKNGEIHGLRAMIEF